MHIVIVDGSRTGLMIIQQMLAPRGEEIALFTDGKLALDYIREAGDVDVVITSFELPGLSGTELCWETRVISDSGRPIYVIGMSANNDPQHVIGILDAGADDFVSKPPRADELSARMRVAERTLQMQRRLIELATIDTLSGAANRRHFRELAARAVVALPSDGCLSLILFDIDHFKRVNDVFGQDAGDDVIREIGKLRIPPDTALGRLDGGQFAVLLPDLPIDGAMSVADFLRDQITAIRVESGDYEVTVTASFGVSSIDANGSLAVLFRDADSALYHAKHSGRNRVSTIQPQLVA